MIEHDLALAASQAECARLREALDAAQSWVCESKCPNVYKTDDPPPHGIECKLLSAALATPSPEDALRAFGERCVLAGRKDAIDEMGAWDAGVARPHQDLPAIVDRVMRGGRDA